MKRRLWKPLRSAALLLWVFAAAAFLIRLPAQFGPPAPRTPVAATWHGRSSAAQPRMVEAYGKLPLAFEANLGQTDPGVKFLSRGPGYNLFLTPTGAVISLRAADSSQQAGATSRSPAEQLKTAHHGNVRFARRQGLQAQAAKVMATRLQTRLVRANPEARAVGLEELPGKVNYFIGSDPRKWRTNAPTYARVRYENIYAGVNLVYYGNQQQLEYDFVVAPGADPRAIQLAVAGAKSLAVDAQGNLVLHAAYGDVCFHRPIAYQQTGATRKEVAASYIVSDQGRVRFRLAPYDYTRPLIIDPVLSYSTYLGGSSEDDGFGITVDSSGNAYVTGRTASADFRVVNPAQGTNAGAFDVFVTKLNSAGTSLAYSTFIGGSQNEFGDNIVVDGSGDAYVVGTTDSTDFPTTAGAFQPTFAGGTCTDLAGNQFPCDAGFVSKLDPTGSKLVYSTYLAGSLDNQAIGLAIDASGSAYVTGETNSPDFPTKNPFQGTISTPYDAFLTKLDPAGSTLTYSTFLGGRSSDDVGAAVAVDAMGDAYVGGFTLSADFPTTPGAFQTTFSGSFPSADAFVTKIDPTKSGAASLIYSTFLGGSDSSFVFGIAVDSSGDAYVTGGTFAKDFPTKNPMQPALAGGADGFVTKLNAAGSALIYSTFLGGTSSEFGNTIALDSSGNAYVTGQTFSADFPTANAFQAKIAGQDDAFVSVLNAGGSAFVYSSFLGGSVDEDISGDSITVDSRGNAYVVGDTESADFPVTPGVFQISNGGLPDVYVVKISPTNAPGTAFGPASLIFSSQPEGTTSSAQTATLLAAGSATLNITSIAITGDFALASGTTCLNGSTLAGGTSCTLSVTFSPSVTGARSGAVTVTDDAAGSPQSLLLSGTGTPPAPIVSLSPTSLNFGPQSVGTSSAAQTVTVNNTGSAALNISSVAITGSNSSEFAVSSGTTCTNGSTVAVSASCVINVTFSPTTAGDASAAVTTSDNAADSPEMVALAGTTPPPDFSFGAPPSAQIISAGQTATYSLSLAGSNGFSGNVSFTCSGAPTASTCSVSPNPAALSGVSPVAVTVGVATTARSSLPPDLHLPRTVPCFGLRLILSWLVLLLIMSLFAMAFRGRLSARRRAWLGLAGIFFVMALFFGCGGGSSTPPAQTGTPAGTSTITVTGTSGGASHSTTLTLTVN